MGTEAIGTKSAVLISEIAFILLLMLPDFSVIVWKSLMKKWTVHQWKLLMRRNRETEEKLKKYWEIDLRKLK